MNITFLGTYIVIFIHTMIINMQFFQQKLIYLSGLGTNIKINDFN